MFYITPFKGEMLDLSESFPYLVCFVAVFLNEMGWGETTSKILKKNVCVKVLGYLTKDKPNVFFNIELINKELDNNFHFKKTLFMFPEFPSFK